MNYNPYAAPQAPPAQPPPIPGGGQPLPWEIGEVFGTAWEGFKANWAILFFSLLLVAFIILVPLVGVVLVLMQLGLYDPRHPAGFVQQQLFSTVFSFGLAFLSSFFEVGLRRIQLAVARGQDASFGDLFSGGRRYLPVLGLQLLLIIPYQVGTLLLVLPVVAIYLCVWMAEYFIIDAEQGTLEGLASGFRAMNGQWLKVFLFMLLGVLLQIAGGLACCVGWIITIPLFELAKGIVFLRISGRGAPPMIAQQPYYGGPPPGYGGPPPGYGGPPPGAPPGGYGPPGGGGGYGGPPGGGYGGPPGGGGGYGGPPGGGGPPPGYGPPR